MNTNDRLAGLLQLRIELSSLLTSEEQTTYPVIVHLDDLIADLQLSQEVGS